MGDNIGGADGDQAIDTVLLSEGSEEEGAAHQQRLEVVQLQKGDNIIGDDDQQAIDTVLPPEEEEGAAYQQRLEVAQRQMGDNIGGAGGEQDIDTVPLSEASEEEGAAHQQRLEEEEEEEAATQQQSLEAVQRQQGDNMGDANDTTKPLPIRPYPGAEDDTCAGDPATLKSDNSGKDEHNSHQAAVVSTPSPQVTDESVGTSVGGSGGDHSPNLPLEPPQGGIELRGNKVSTELDGDSMSRDSSTGVVPAASPALLSTSPAPLGHRAAIASTPSPHATDDPVGTSFGGRGGGFLPLSFTRSKVG
ncbi:unnamed protein product [Ectocarpus sp. 12 AP-2014]